MSFDSLRKLELVAAAKKLGVEIDPKDNKPALVDAIEKAGKTWEMYLRLPAEDEDVVEDDNGDFVWPEQDEDDDDTEAEGNDAEPVKESVVVKQELPLASKPKWLIKMVRANPLYETHGHRFTQKNPFALVTAEEAEYLLTREDGFRQATPKELEQYYG